MAIGTTAALIMGGLSAAGALGGSALQRSAAKSAANTQTQAAQQAGQQVVDATNQVNPSIGAAANTAATNVGNVADAVAQKAEQSAFSANRMLDPYAALGGEAVNALSLGMDRFTKEPTMADLQIDPGFAFRLAEGQKALERSAAGRVLGGRALRETTRYSQGVASDEYQKAFERHRASTNDAFSRLFNLTGMGVQAAGTQGKNLIDTSQWGGTARLGAAEYGGNLQVNAADRMSQNTINAARASGEFMTQGANASAAGDIRSANAVSSGITGATGGLMNALLLQKLMAAPPQTVQMPAGYNPQSGVPSGAIESALKIGK